MQYLVLIYGSEAQWDKVPPAEVEAIHKEYGELIGEPTGKGKFLAGSQLKPTSMTTMVPVREGVRRYAVALQKWPEEGTPATHAERFARTASLAKQARKRPAPQSRMSA